MGCRVWGFCCLLTVYLQRCSCRLLAAFVSSKGFFSGAATLMMERWDHQVSTKAATQLNEKLFFSIRSSLYRNVNFPERCFFSECTMRFSSTSADTTHCFQRKETVLLQEWENRTADLASRRGSWVLPASHLHLCRFLSSPGATFWQQFVCVYAFWWIQMSLRFCVEKEEGRVKFNF